ncbi:hypothetical protein WBJ53_04015 [Spirosoma sp. SC4-14]|uniref:hypothetical protein n=1 Tax=Spirosoma sp. SC4-14 TaxID=3128900 RepID=UPI0030D15D09
MRIILLSLSCLLSLVVNAQDSLIFRNGTELSVKVLEVSPSQLKYRRQDNPNGPVYSITIDDVLLIKYANGTKDVFGTGNTVARQPESTARELSPMPQPGLSGLRYRGGLFKQYFVDDNGEPLPRTEVRTQLANHHDALLAYRHGQSLRRFSWVAALSSAALIGTGTGLLLFQYDHWRSENRPLTTQTGNTTPVNDRDHDRRGFRRDLGIALGGSGLIMGAAALLLNYRANSLFRRAAFRYNQHQRTVGMEWAPSLQGTGIAMKLTF